MVQESYVLQHPRIPEQFPLVHLGPRASVMLTLKYFDQEICCTYFRARYLRHV